MKRNKYFTCSPKNEPFCCFTERLTLLPNEIRNFKEGWENGGVLLPLFRGIYKIDNPHSKLIAQEVSLIDLKEVSLVVRMEINFFPLIPERKISEHFKNYLRKRFKLKGTLAFRCPFLKGKNCSIYKNRPLFCRLFPVYIGKSLQERFAECFECGGLDVLQGKSIKKQEKINRRELLKRKKDIEEWKKFVRNLFTKREILSEVIKIMEEIRNNPYYLHLLLNNPNFICPLISAIQEVYDYFGIDINKQIQIVERAWKLAEEEGDEVFIRDYKSIHSLLKKVSSKKRKFKAFFAKPLTQGETKKQIQELLKTLEQLAPTL